jgi:hypothetical protein
VGTANSKEPDLQRAETIAREHCILRGIVGSSQTAALERELENPTLPLHPDRERVDRFLVSAYARAWAPRFSQ